MTVENHLFNSIGSNLLTHWLMNQNVIRV